MIAHPRLEAQRFKSLTDHLLSFRLVFYDIYQRAMERYRIIINSYLLCQYSWSACSLITAIFISPSPLSLSDEEVSVQVGGGKGRTTVHDVRQVNFGCQFLARVVDDRMRVYVRLKRTKSREWILVLRFSCRWIGHAIICTKNNVNDGGFEVLTAPF